MSSVQSRANKCRRILELFLTVNYFELTRFGIEVLKRFGHIVIRYETALDDLGVVVGTDCKFLAAGAFVAVR